MIGHGESKLLKGVALFGKGMKAACSDILASVAVLLVATAVLGAILGLLEHNAQPDAYPHWTYGYVWTLMCYLSNAGNFSPEDPVTFWGRIIWLIIAIINILIFAVPAGLVANGFSAAMDKDKREKKLGRYHERMLKAFSFMWNRDLNKYVEGLLKDNPGAWYEGVDFRFIPNNVSAAKFELQGMDMKDIYDVCQKYPDFRLVNEAKAKSTEDGRHDRFMVEYVPINRRYGCCINRGSKVTIVSTSNKFEIGMGNYAYYLAAFAGFNYISKDFDVAVNVKDSYYNIKELVGTEKHYEEKNKLRTQFFDDLKSLAKDEDSWVISILSFVPSKANPCYLHMAHSSAEEGESTVHDEEKYQSLVQLITYTLKDELADSDHTLLGKDSNRYPLLKEKDKDGNLISQNILYKLQEEKTCNGFVIRISSHLMLFDSHARLMQFMLAKSIKEALAPDEPLSDDTRKELNRRGYPEKNEDKNIKKIFHQIVEETVEKEDD